MFLNKKKNHLNLDWLNIKRSVGGPRPLAKLVTTLKSVFPFSKKRKTAMQISSFYPISGKGGVGGVGGGSIKYSPNGGMFGGGGPDVSPSQNEDRNEKRNFNLIQGGDFGGGGTAGGGSGHGG